MCSSKKKKNWMGGRAIFNSEWKIKIKSNHSLSLECDPFVFWSILVLLWQLEQIFTIQNALLSALLKLINEKKLRQLRSYAIPHRELASDLFFGVNCNDDRVWPQPELNKKKNESAKIWPRSTNFTTEPLNPSAPNSLCMPQIDSKLCQNVRKGLFIILDETKKKYF